MKQLVVFPRGQLSAKDRRALAKAGVCVVEADDPTKVVTVLPGAPLIASDDMLRAALKAISAGSYQSDICRAFVTSLAASVAKERS